MNYTVKFVVIIGLVAVASFFTASLVIPEKNAVAPSRKKSAVRAFVPQMPRSGDIPIVVVDGKPAEKPILVSAVGEGPVDLNELAPTAAEPTAAKAAPVDAKSVASVAPVDAKVPPVVAELAPAEAAPVTFSTKTDSAVAESEPFVGRVAELLDARLSPPNTMATRLYAEFAPKPKAPPVDTAQVAPPLVVASAPVAAVAPVDTVRKRVDPNAPLGYRIASTAVCSAVENRAPVGVANKFSKEAGAVYYFTYVVGAADSAAVMHRWYREGKLIQTSILQIRSSNWRTHSKRNLATVDEPAGDWRVEVVDQRSGKVLESSSFTVE